MSDNLLLLAAAGGAAWYFLAGPGKASTASITANSTATANTQTGTNPLTSPVSPSTQTAPSNPIVPSASSQGSPVTPVIQSSPANPAPMYLPSSYSVPTPAEVGLPSSGTSYTALPPTRIPIAPAPEPVVVAPPPPPPPPTPAWTYMSLFNAMSGSPQGQNSGTIMAARDWANLAQSLGFPINPDKVNAEMGAFGQYTLQQFWYAYLPYLKQDFPTITMQGLGLIPVGWA